MKGAEGWQLSNAQVLPMAVHKASLDIFDEAGMEHLRAKSVKLTGYLEFVIDEVNAGLTDEQQLKSITPRDANQRGAQLSIVAGAKGRELFSYLSKNGVVADWREPDVIRMAPVPLYNSFEDIYRLGELLHRFYIS